MHLHGLLDDTIMNAAMGLFMRQFPNVPGMQDITLVHDGHGAMVFNEFGIQPLYSNGHFVLPFRLQAMPTNNIMYLVLNPEVPTNETKTKIARVFISPVMEGVTAQPIAVQGQTSVECGMHSPLSLQCGTRRTPTSSSPQA